MERLRQGRPFGVAIALARGELEPAKIFQRRSEMVQKRSLLNSRTIAKKALIASHVATPIAAPSKSAPMVAFKKAAPVLGAKKAAPLLASKKAAPHIF
jgi:hypothetical protein